MVAHVTGLIVRHVQNVPVFYIALVLTFADIASVQIIQVNCRQKQTASTAS